MEELKMQKNMIKALGVFTLVLFVLSMTGAAAATCTPCKANPDNFAFSKYKTCGNVLKNDVGVNKEVITTAITTSKGVKVTMDKKGNFCYKPPASCPKTGIIKDSFKYTIKCSCPKTCNCKKPSTATVTINYKCR
jgi:hypothetical protein